MPWRKVFLWAGALALMACASVLAQGGLRVVPLVSDHDVVVSFDATGAYTDDVRAAILSGLKTTVTYEIELRMVVPTWVDRTIASAIVTVSDQYDNLTRRHTLTRVVDGRIEDEQTTEDEAVVKRWLTSLSRVPVVRTSKLDQTRDYYVRVRARVRPRGTSILGWTSALSGEAKFTFIP